MHLGDRRVMWLLQSQGCQLRTQSRSAEFTFLRGLCLSKHRIDLLGNMFVGYIHPFCQGHDFSRGMWVTMAARATCIIKKCHVCSNYNNYVIIVPIALKLGMWVGTHQAMHFHVSR